MLGVTPILGRSFVPAEDEPVEHDLPVILSYGLWQTRFGGQSNVIGRAMTLDGRKFDVEVPTLLLASYIPARRATKVDPMAALRHE